MSDPDEQLYSNSLIEGAPKRNELPEVQVLPEVFPDTRAESARIGVSRRDFNREPGNILRILQCSHNVG